MNDTVLDAITADHPNLVLDCCKDMLSQWLQKDPEASWEKLFRAADITNDHASG